MIGLRQLQSTHAKHGKVVFINIRKKRREPVVEVNCVHAISGEGLEGDRYNKAGGSRQVTLIQAEHRINSWQTGKTGRR